MNTSDGWGSWDKTVVVPQPIAPAKPTIPPHIQTLLANENLSVDKDGLLMLQQRHKHLLDYYKDSEMELRKLCIPFLLEKPKEGVNNVELGNGFTAKVGIAYNYKLDESNEKIENTLETVARISNEAGFIADRIITWEAHFHVGEYRKLQEDAESTDAMISGNARSILKALEAVLTITDKAPTLDVKEPKSKGRK